MPRKDDIQGLLTDRFKNFEAEPQVDLWKGIEAGLYPEKRSARKLWPYFSIAASIAILIFTWIYLGKTEVKQNLVPAFVEESPSTPQEKQEIDAPELIAPAKELDEGTELASEEKVLTPKPQNENQLQRNPIQQKEVLQAQVVRNKTEAPISPQDLVNKQELMENAVAVKEESLREEKKELTVEVSPFSEELFAINTVKVEQPKAEQIPVTQPVLPVEGGDNGSNILDLNNISFKNIVSFASDGIDKIKDASPVKVYEEKNEQGESKVYQLNLFKLSVSHKTQKRRNKKVRL